ncbi:MAG: nucleotide exchange factor GrpE [Nostocaceae cyanobacterium]|nr:nucleotide exchange factor GrpE [Nostocaceae cyanobacterium]
MAQKSPIFQLSAQQRQLLQQTISTLLKEKVVLQQAVREQQETAAAEAEELFLEILEILDSLEFLVKYLNNNSHSVPQSWSSLPKSLATLEKKLLGIMARRQVNCIDFQGTQPDFTMCRVVDKEVRNDMENQTITQVVRRGFRWGDKLLRPVEVIVSKTD